MRPRRHRALFAGALLTCILGSAAEAANPKDAAPCKRLWEGTGLPGLKASLLQTEDYTFVCHEAYVLLHDNNRKTPVYVLEHLVQRQVSGDFNRPDQPFREDPALPEGRRAVDKDYTGSKFDRGHQAPSADFSVSEELMRESFLLSNAVPQQGIGFNRHIWAALEDLVRNLVVERGELYVITGPIYPPDDETEASAITQDSNPCGNAIDLPAPKRASICGKDTKCENGVAVPSALFKVLYDPKMQRTNAYILPNINHNPLKKTTKPLEYLDKFRVPVETVEAHTGLNLFPAFSARERRVRTVHCTARMLH
ncbi:MAG TPA: DNA/RNA non-specific endonuclease [Beijerinckiaceae bacterium]|jgi:endonuclease G